MISTSSERGRKAKRLGREAEIAVEQLFHDWGWDPRADLPDEGFDFNVEVPKSEKHPAHRFLVQVKGSEDIEVRSNGSWAVSVGTKRLKAYQEHRMAVFIVVYDKTTKSLRWCDADKPKLIAEPRSKDGGTERKTTRASKSVQVRLPANQTLGPARDPSFLAAVHEAWKRRDDRYHGPALAAAGRAGLMEQLDPRLQVRVDVVNGAEVHIVGARSEPVNVTARILPADKQNAEALLNSFRFGIPATIQTKSFRIEGSALFESLPISGELRLG
jgi:Domain of unknown function (DUF4365)